MFEYRAMQCGQCAHWMEVDQASPGAGVIVGGPKNGVCRGIPPALLMLGLMGNGQITVQPQYPAIASNFAACAQFAERPPAD